MTGQPPATLPAPEAASLLMWALETLASVVDVPVDPLQATRQWLQAATGRLQASGFESGCPLATIALETTAADTALRQALARAFDRVRRRLAQALTSAGHDTSRADALAALIVSAYEGGLLQARVAHSTDPLNRVTDALLDLLAPVARPDSPATGATP